MQIILTRPSSPGLRTLKRLVPKLCLLKPLMWWEHSIPSTVLYLNNHFKIPNEKKWNVLKDVFKRSFFLLFFFNRSMSGPAWGPQLPASDETGGSGQEKSRPDPSGHSGGGRHSPHQGILSPSILPFPVQWVNELIPAVAGWEAWTRGRVTSVSFPNLDYISVSLPGPLWWLE